MRVDYRRGFFRLMAAVAVPWVTYWTALAVRAALRYSELSQAKAALEARGDFAGGGNIYSLDMQPQLNAIGDAICWGAAVPLAMLILYVAGAWVYRGFRPATGASQAR